MAGVRCAPAPWSRWRRRSPGSLYSGNSCRKDVRGSVLGPDRAIASAGPAPPSAFPAYRSRIAVRSVPGMQTANRQFRRCRIIPSIVSTVALCVCTASSRQERTISPLTRTVHAPHTPCSQPTCVPVSLRCSRRKSARFRRGSTSASTRSPLTTSEIATAAVTLTPPHRDQDDQAARIRNAPTGPSPDAGAWRVSPVGPPEGRVHHPMQKTPRTTPST